MNVPGGLYKIVLDPGGGPGSHLQLEVGQDCEFSVDSGELEEARGDLGESVEILPLHHPASQEITYIQVRVLHLDTEDCYQELLRQQSYTIKNQLVASKAP